MNSKSNIEDELEKCLRFDSESELESVTEKLIREAISELRLMRIKISGWDGHAWKYGEYIDNLEEYFED